MTMNALIRVCVYVLCVRVRERVTNVSVLQFVVVYHALSALDSHFI